MINVTQEGLIKKSMEVIIRLESLEKSALSSIDLQCAVLRKANEDGC